MGQLWRMSCRESFASKGDGQGQGPGPGEEGRSGQDGRRKGRDWRRGCRGRQEWGRVWIYSRSLENLWIFQAGRCHDLISPFLFKIPLGPACRIGWTEEGAESDMGLNDLMIQHQFWAHSRPSIRMLDLSGIENNAGEEERRFHLAVCSLVCPGTNFNRAKPQLPQMYNRVKNTPYLPHPGRTQERRHTEQQPGACPSGSANGAVDISRRNWSGCGAGAKGRGEACSYFAHCAVNSGCQAAGVSCMSAVWGSETCIPASSL